MFHVEHVEQKKVKVMLNCNKCKKLKNLRSSLVCAKMDLDRLYAILFFEQYLNEGLRKRDAHRCILKAFEALRVEEK